MLLDSGDGGVVYVNKTTYDQALILHNRFDGDLNRVINVINCKKTEAYIVITELKKLVDTMFKEMPEPINILAPFLIFCTQNQGIEWNGDDVEFGYGILHQFSQLMDFNAITLVPPEVRVNISLPTAIIMQYKDSWKSLCETLEDKIMLMPTMPQTQQVPAVPVVQYVQAVSTPVPVTENRDTDASEQTGGLSSSISELNAAAAAVSPEPVVEETSSGEESADGEVELSEEEYNRIVAAMAAIEENLNNSNKKIGSEEKDDEANDSLLEDKDKLEREACSKILDEYRI